MTLPWNTWTRSLLPSTTLTWTFTSSPGPNSGRSVRRYWLSTRSVDFMARTSCRPGEMEQLRIGDGRELFQQPVVEIVEAAAGLDQVGAVAERAVQRLGPPPAFDPA